MRVRGGPAKVEWNGGPAEPGDLTYRIAPVGRENPQGLRVTVGGRIVFDDSLVLHHGVRYTLVLDARPHVVID
jgi:hypothetical protein